MKYILLSFIFSLLTLLLFAAPKAYATISFTISNPTVNSDDSIDLDASISGLISSSCSTSGCYLQGELQVLDGSKSYFGYTYNNSGDFVDFFSAPSSTDDIKSKLFNFVPTSGAWSGKLKAKNNPDDSNYIGPGQYMLRFRRFSGNSTSATSGDSNALTVSLTLASPTPTPSPTPSPSPTPKPTSTPTPTPTPKPSVSPQVSAVPSKTASASTAVLSDSTATSASYDLADSTLPSSSPQAKKQEKFLASTNIAMIIFFLVGGSLIAAAVGWVAFDKFYKENKFG